MRFAFLFALAICVLLLVSSNLANATEPSADVPTVSVYNSVGGSYCAECTPAPVRVPACVGGRCGATIPVLVPGVVIPAPQPVYTVPVQPYDLKAVGVQEKRYSTPLRNHLFGRWNIFGVYSRR